MNEQFDAAFLAPPSGAVADLKARLQHDYEEAYPQLAEIIHLVIDEEEANARELSFPHLFLPDLVAAHIEKLNLQPVGKSYAYGSPSHGAFPGAPTRSTHVRAGGFSTHDPALRAA